jgi:WD40 repeat protein
VWNAATGQVIATLEGHSHVVWSAAFSPDGQRVVTASADKTARVWNAASGDELARLEGYSNLMPTMSRAVALAFQLSSAAFSSAAFSPDGQRVVRAGGDKTAQVWNAVTGEVIAKLEGHSGIVRSVAFSPDGQRVVTASGDRTARVWNAASGQVIAKLEGHPGFADSAAFSPDGQHIVIAGRDHIARVFKIVTLDDIDRLLASK